MAENLERADEATGLEGDDLENFHKALVRGLQGYGPVLGAVQDPKDFANEIRARYAAVAEEVLGPERAHAYLDALFDESGSEERGRRYMEERQKGKDPDVAARVAGGEPRSEPDAGATTR